MLLSDLAYLTAGFVVFTDFEASQSCVLALTTILS